MKYTLLLATTFLAITTPALGMEDEQEKKTLFVIAQLDPNKSERIRKCGECFDSFPSVYYHKKENPARQLSYKEVLYDHKNHIVIFKADFPVNDTETYDFNIKYAPVSTTVVYDQCHFTHTFSFKPSDSTKLQIPDNVKWKEQDGKARCIVDGKLTEVDNERFFKTVEGELAETAQATLLKIIKTTSRKEYIGDPPTPVAASIEHLIYSIEDTPHVSDQVEVH
jgi:hypothetical protein